MSVLKLGNIKVFDNSLTSSTFIVADQYPGGGYEDPAIVTNTLDLYKKFRFAPEYNSWSRIIEGGASLAVLGNRKSFDDYATLVVFPNYQCHPKYLDLFKDVDELVKELMQESLINQYTLFLTLDNAHKNREIFTIQDFQKYLRFASRTSLDTAKESLLHYTGSVSPEYEDAYTYKIKIKPKYTYLKNVLIYGISKGEIYTLVLPRQVEDSEYEYNNYAILFTKGNTPDTTNIQFSEKGITGVLAKIDVTDLNSNLDILNAVIKATAPDSATELRDIYYTHGEDLYVEGEDTDNPYLVLETPYLIRAYDFCYKFCDLFEYEIDYEFTQKILYVRGLLENNLILAGHSTIPNKEGRGVEIKYSCSKTSNSDYWHNLVVKAFDESFEYVGNKDLVLSDSKSNEYFKLLIINDIDIKEKLYVTKSYNEGEWNEESTYNAYNSLIEYEIPASVVIPPINPLTWYNTPLITLLKKLSKPQVYGGCTATICIQVNNPNEVLVLNKRLSINNDFSSGGIFLFSGGISGPTTYKSVYQYLIKYLTTGNFNASSGSEVLKSIPNTWTIDYNGYELVYGKDKYYNPWEYIVSLGISHILNSLYYEVTPGMYANEAKSILQVAAKYAVDNNPLISSIDITDILVNNGTLTANIDIYYNKLNNIVKINFNIYKNNG